MRVRVVCTALMLFSVGVVGLERSTSLPKAAAMRSPAACDPNYLPCIPPPPPDLNCADIGQGVRVIGPSDPHNLDADHDGVACETFGPAPPPPTPAPPATSPPPPVVCRAEPVSSAPAPTSTTARFVPLSPVRLFDTRFGGAGPVCPGGTITVQVSGRVGVPAGASAVALNVTAAEAMHSGFVTIWPAG